MWAFLCLVVLCLDLQSADDLSIYSSCGLGDSVIDLTSQNTACGQERCICTELRMGQSNRNCVLGVASRVSDSGDVAAV